MYKHSAMPQTFIEKIAQRFAVGLKPGQEVRSGDYIAIRPAYVMTHDNSGAVIPKFRSIGASKIADPRQVVFTLDHDIQNRSEPNLAKYARIEAFAREHDIDFYPAGRGIGHQIMVEEGYAWPGMLVVASDSHSNMYGGIGCLGTPVVRTDAAAIWATGQTWWQVPPVARVELKGTLLPGVTGKDVIITLCGHFNRDEVLNCIVEFCGEGVSALSIDERFTIANMTTEWGALAGVFPVDDRTFDWLDRRCRFVTRRGLAGVASDAYARDGEHSRINRDHLEALRREAEGLQPDPGAFYAKTLTLNLNSVEPYVSGPDTVKDMRPISAIRNKKVKVDKAYLVSCVNSRVADLKEAAQVLRGHKVADSVKFYVSAASSEVQAESRKNGDWQALLEAGAIELPPGCGPCIGLGAGTLEDGEVGISATNRNFKGRMGSRNAHAYLASPAVVAASALSGYIDYPGDWRGAGVMAQLTVNEKDAGKSSNVDIIPGFPEVISGEVLFCHQDNLNTDGIYPGKYTYQDNITPEKQAAVVMENYDPDFQNIARAGDILAGGFNFGTGSSREQAATALKFRGIRLVLAGSFSETYKRNALNNGFLAIESPELVEKLKHQFGTERPTVRTGIHLTVDFKNARIRTGDSSHPIDPIGAAAQELIVAGGLENWVRKKL